MSSSGPYSQKSRPALSGQDRPLIGVIGGSGLCSLPNLRITETRDVKTVYGRPSGMISMGELGGVGIAFLPRHGPEHDIPPHKVPYKANLAALKEVGVSHVIATCIVGSLREEIEPGTFVIPDQFINLTWGRDDTSSVDRKLIHLPMAYPYCEHIRGAILYEAQDLGLRIRPSGTVVVIQGPRFSTVAESRMFASWGGDIVNMTQYPECYFARELGLCYGAVAAVTDYDVGVPSAISMQPDSMDKVLGIFRRNVQSLLMLVEELARCADELTTCSCAQTRMEEYYRATETPTLWQEG